MLAAAGESDSSGDAASYQQRSELFSYDGLNRLSGSAMTVGTGASAISDSRWSERNIRYDLDGNLLHLERYQENANTPQATLDFSYDGPKRVGYAYDSNGNITYDPLRCFEIRYNLLNLASEVIGHDPEESAVSSLICDGDSEFLYPKDVVTDFGYIDLQSGSPEQLLRLQRKGERDVGRSGHCLRR